MALVSRRSLEASRELQESSDVEIERLQLARLNSVWEAATAEVPYYVDLIQRGVPRVFRSIEQYRSSVPILTKQMIREDYSRFCYSKPAPNTFRMTGGSTSTPLQLPAWKNEFDSTRLDPWIGRGWYGVRPSDRLFLYWGHSHLLGTGYRRVLNRFTREIKDKLQNYQRCSCYDMSPPAMAKAVEAIRRSRARFVIGYASSLDRLARYCRDEGLRLDALGIKVVIATAEAFPQLDSAELIAQVFGAPVGMEYGSVETSLVAHSAREGGFRVFWWNQILEHEGADSEPVHITSLYRRCTPLFRYELGDQFVAGPRLRRSSGGSVVSFERVMGRLNAQIQLPNGRAVHSEAVTHIVRHLSVISGYQLVVRADGIRLDVVARADLSPEDIAAIKSRARQVDSEFGELLEVKRVDRLQQTVAGKTPMVLHQIVEKAAVTQ